MSAAVVQRLIDAVSAGTLRAETDLLAPDVVVHAAGYPVSGPAAAQLMAGAVFDAFRDIRISHQIVLDEDGQVVAAFDARGTQVKPLFGVSPRQRETRITGIATIRLAGDRVKEVHLTADLVPPAAEGATSRTEAPPPPGPSAAPADRPSADTGHQTWLAGLAALSAAEHYGARVVQALLEQGRAAAAAGEAVVHRVLDGAGEPPPSREEFRALQRKVDELAARLARDER